MTTFFQRLKMHEEKQTKQKSAENVQEGAVPAYLLDREKQNRAKILSNMIKQKRKEKAGKWEVPLPKVKAVSQSEVFKVVKTGKSRSIKINNSINFSFVSINNFTIIVCFNFKGKAWKRMVTKACFVGENFTRKPPKFERFIRPMGLRYTKAHVTHPELKATFCLPIIGVKKNPSSPLFTSLGVITKGTVIEVTYLQSAIFFFK
jgi:ribosome biogenesis protein NSA2